METSVDISEIVRKVMAEMEGKHEGEKAEVKRPFEFADPAAAVEASSAAQKVWHRDFKIAERIRIIDGMRAFLKEHVDELARVALEDTGMGRFDDKVRKKLMAIEKTPGPEYFTTKAVSGDDGLVLEEYSPYGVIASITPSTNPVASVINNTICMISGGNSVVFAPHPGARKSTLRVIELINDWLVAEGAPHGLVTCLTEISMENVDNLMRHPKVRLVAATGGPGVVKAALSSGKPAIGAGPGNPPVVVDETADLKKAAVDIIMGCSFDNNLPCTSEKELIVVNCVADILKKNMLEEGAFELKDPGEIAALKKLVLTEKGTPNKAFIGKDATFILEKIGIRAPAKTRLILIEAEESDPLVQEEMLMPILGMVRVSDFEEALAMALRVEHGFRHSACIHSNNLDHMSRMARAMETTMFTKNAASFASLGVGGECPTAFTIATTTGQGPTTPVSFCRVRRCTLHGAFRIV
jgi:propionaldehyde dehydrogenase